MHLITPPQVSPDVACISNSEEYHSTSGSESFHIRLRVWYMLMVEEPTVTGNVGRQ